MIRVLSAGRAPALPNFVTSALENLFISRVLPLNEVFDDLEEPLALFLLRLLGLENIRVRRRIIYHLRKDHRPRRRQWPPRPPKMQRRRMPMPNRLLPRRRFIDRLQRERNFDKFLVSHHSLVSPSSPGRE